MPDKTKDELLREGIQLAMLLTQQVCQDDKLHKMFRSGKLSAVGRFYNWATVVEETLKK